MREGQLRQGQHEAFRFLQTPKSPLTWPQRAGREEKYRLAAARNDSPPPLPKAPAVRHSAANAVSPCSSQGLVYIRELNQRCDFKPVQLNCYTFLIEPRFQQKLLVFK